MVDKHLSHYHITAELGRGGMGIVYKATDTKLNRDVAIKVLPAAALASKDDRARFFREAQAAAQLTHAHIATVYEIDEAIPEDASGNPVNASDGPRPFIAMEYIEGGTLEERIEQSPLKLEEAVRLASEIADALKAAHAKNIVHRDIKSANVMMTPEGKAKVLDFGLAKTTHSTMLTKMGSTLGTVAFMSPEQARGEEVDSRTDLYSLGTILYEMIAGRRPFAGEYEQAVVYGILNEEPEPLTALRSGVPMDLEWIVNKCLAKRADDRYQTASDLMVDLRNLDLSAPGMSRVSVHSTASTSTSPAPASPASVVSMSSTSTAPDSRPEPAAQAKRTQKKSIMLMAAVATVAVFIGLVAGYLVFRSAPEERPLQRVTINLPGIRNARFLTLSPSRELLAFYGQDVQNQFGIFLRDMASGEIRFIKGTDGVGQGSEREIVFSPGGDRLAYTLGGNGGVFTVVVPAGLPERQTEKGRISFWEDNNTLIFVDDVPGGQTFRKSIGGGDPELIEIDHGELSEGYVTIWKTMISGSGIAFGHQLARTANLQSETSWLVRAHLRDGESVTRVESPIMNPEYVLGGFLAYQQRNDTGTLVVRPVNPETGEFLGPPREALGDELTRWGQFAVTADGDLLYRTSTADFGVGTQYVFHVDLQDRRATVLPMVVPDGSALDDVIYSPDGSRLAFIVGANNEFNLVVYDMEDETLTQISFGFDVSLPSWSSDGDWLYYSVRSDSSTDIYRQHPVASSTPELVLLNAFMGDTSPDGRYLAFSRPDSSNTADNINLMVLDLETAKIRTLDAGPGYHGEAQFSPDGKYVVYEYFNNASSRVNPESCVCVKKV